MPADHGLMLRRIGPLARINAFGAAWMGVIVMPVYVPFLTARGLAVGDVLSLLGVQAVAVMLFEIPTGYICDVLGRRRTILIGAAMNLAGLAGFTLVHGFAAYALVMLVLAGGVSLVSGADIALIYDTLDLRGADRPARRRALANYVLAQVLGEAVLGLFGAALASWSLPAVGWVTAAEAVLPLLIALTLPSGGGAGPVMRLASVPPALTALFRRPGLGLLFANIVAWNLSTFIAVWLLQPYWREQGVGLRWFGLLWAGTLLTAGLVSRTAPALTLRFGPRTALLVLTLAPACGYAGMAVCGGAAGVAAGFLFYVSRGLNAVNLKEAFNHQVPSALRATLNSVSSGAFRLGFALVGPLLGLAVDRKGLDWTLTLLAGVFLLCFATLGVPLIRRSGAA